MILDNQTLFSDAQAITADAGSTNTIDLAPIASGIVRDIGAGIGIPLAIQVVEAFNNLTSLAVLVQVDDNTSFSSAKTVATTPAIALASLVAGYRFNIDYVPRGTDERYMRLYYDITGTAPTTGKITAGITMGHAQTNG